MQDPGFAGLPKRECSTYWRRIPVNRAILLRPAVSMGPLVMGGPGVSSELQIHLPCACCSGFRLFNRQTKQSQVAKCRRSRAGIVKCIPICTQFQVRPCPRLEAQNVAVGTSTGVNTACQLTLCRAAAPFAWFPPPVYHRSGVYDI